MVQSLAQGRSTHSAARAEDRIYDAIRHAVLAQQLPPGSRLPELTLSEIFGVSRSVVRRALVRLAGDHIILMRRNQIAVVARPGPEETAQIFEARRHIESEVIRQVAGHLGETARTEIAGLVDAEHTAHREGAHEDRIHLSLRFHERLADFCPNQVLAGILRELILRTSIAVALYKVPGISACYREGDHRGITDAIFAGDSELAARLAREHLDHLEQRLTLAERDGQVDLASILRR
ncbi:GntR family transcriptional regulator [Arhodomonas aquaeolei]|uniref:GntR family transcriptional regulator n=1 Tax=Arhodomonas aquaeolei TaxID=2369 RepID=UPI00037ABC49|nr:GntR family transcriptional regulator [Arhodomonas aquaeolei]